MSKQKKLPTNCADVGIPKNSAWYAGNAIKAYKFREKVNKWAEQHAKEHPDTVRRFLAAGNCPQIPVETSMMKISDHDINIILDIVSMYYDQTQDLPGAARKEHLLRYVHTALHHKQDRIHERVCHKCLGTGYEDDEALE